MSVMLICLMAVMIEMVVAQPLTLSQYSTLFGVMDDLGAQSPIATGHRVLLTIDKLIVFIHSHLGRSEYILFKQTEPCNGTWLRCDRGSVIGM
jgi:hypothetical protein